MKKILLIGLLTLLSCPVVNAQVYISPWSTGLEIDEDKAYSVETRGETSKVLVQYAFPGLVATGKELVLNSEFDYGLINSSGLAIYDYKETRQEGESEVLVNASLDISTYDSNFTLVATKSVDLGSYSYPVGDAFLSKKKSKKTKAKFLPNALIPSPVLTAIPPRI